MATKKHTISVRLDAEAEQRLTQAARIVHQSRGAFLQSAGEAKARQVLLDWATSRYRAGDSGFSELATQTGLPVEEIMFAVGDQHRTDALAQFLASCRTVAEASANPAFLERAQAAVAAVEAEAVSAQ